MIMMFISRKMKDLEPLSGKSNDKKGITMQLLLDYRLLVSTRKLG